VRIKSVRRLPCLVLASGGLDSTACLGYYRARHQPVTALFVDYGQRARAMESRAVGAVCNRLRVPLKRLRMAGPSIPVGVIRGRNALLLVAALMSFDAESGLISLGIHAGTPYPDCSAAFVDQVQSIYDAYCAGQVRIDAPFATWTKSEIYDFAVKRRLPLHLTYSCLLGRRRPCGSCESCKDLEALHAS
jgi:7-cyano-7-deazaguanine synthase